MSTVLVVEPNPGGHRLQFVAHLVREAPGLAVTLLTSTDARHSDEFTNFLGELDLEVIEAYTSTQPTATVLVDVLRATCRSRNFDEIVVFEADQPLKVWWRKARSLPSTSGRRPRTTLLLMRYPTRHSSTERRALAIRIAKASLAVAALTTRSAQRVLALTTRDDRASGLLVGRVLDPAVCSAHSRDRITLRAAHGLPPDEPVIGVFGAINAGKNVAMLATAVFDYGPDARLLLAGALDAETQEWVETQPGELRDRLIVRSGFLPDDTIDGLLAACDAVGVLQDFDAPSGIMGKALAAEVPVLTAGSRVRARELAKLGRGMSTELTQEAVTRALGELLNAQPAERRASDIDVATPASFVATILSGSRGNR